MDDMPFMSSSQQCQGSKIQNGIYIQSTDPNQGDHPVALFILHSSLDSWWNGPHAGSGAVSK